MDFPYGPRVSTLTAAHFPPLLFGAGECARALGTLRGKRREREQRRQLHAQLACAHRAYVGLTLCGVDQGVRLMMLKTQFALRFAIDHLAEDAAALPDEFALAQDTAASSSDTPASPETGKKQRCPRKRTSCRGQRPASELPEDLPFPVKRPEKGKKGAHPWLLIALMDRLKPYADEPEKYLPEIHAVLGEVLIGGRARARRKDGKCFALRSEMRVAIIVTLWALLKYTDLASLRVINPYDKRLNLTDEYLAGRAGLSIARFQRAMRWLKAAGYVTVNRCWNKKQGKDGKDAYEGMPALRTVSPVLFGSFGLGKHLTLERAKARKRRRAATQHRHHDRRGHGPVQLDLLGMTRNNTPRQPQACIRGPVPAAAYAGIKHEMAILTRAGELYQADPTIGHVESRRLARRQLEPPGH